MTAPLLRVEHLVTGYSGVPVVHGVDLSVGAGEVVALVGANGRARHPPCWPSPVCFPCSTAP